MERSNPKESAHVAWVKLWMRYSVFIMVLLGMTHATAYAPSGTFLVDDSIETVSLAIDEQLPTYIESGQVDVANWQQWPFTIDDFEPSVHSGPEAYWYRLTFTAHDSLTLPVVLHLSVESYIFKHLDFYIMEGARTLKHVDKGLQTGTFDAYFDGINIAFTLNPKQTVTVLVRKQTDAMAILPMQLHGDLAFNYAQEKRFMFWGAFIAIQLALAVYNAMIFLMRPGRAYFWYLAFHCCAFLSLASAYGFGFKIWSIDVQRVLGLHSITWTFPLAILVIQFLRAFINTREHAPTFEKLLRILIPVQMVLFLVFLFVPHFYVIPLYQISVLCVLFCVLGASIVALRNGFRPARYYLLAWVFTAIGAFVEVFTFSGMLPANMYTMHAFGIGLVCELLLLSLGLGDRIQFIERKMMDQAYTDPHTQSPNFSFFKGLLPQQMAVLSQQYSNIHVLVIEFKGFREMVGVLGPDILDEAYEKHVRQLEHFVSKASWGVPLLTPAGARSFMVTLPGDQGMLLVNPSERAGYGLPEICKELLRCSTEPITVQGLHSQLSLHIGCASLQQCQGSLAESYRQAQVALLTTHNEGSDFCVYQPEQGEYIKHQIALLSELREAITANSLEIFIQPQFNLQTGVIAGGEVLVRWHHQGRGTISPGIFVPLAEQGGMIFDITRLVIWKSFKALSRLNCGGELTLSLNISALDMRDERLLPLISQAVQRYKINPQHVVLEITESALMMDPDSFLRRLASLQGMGFKIAIDDFGTGYSSMAYLQQIKAKEIKIDMQFVRDIDRSETNRSIVRSVIQLARATGARTVAEGIESDDELSVIKSLNCDYAQGFLWSEAISVDEFISKYRGDLNGQLPVAVTPVA